MYLYINTNIYIHTYIHRCVYMSAAWLKTYRVIKVFAEHADLHLHNATHTVSTSLEHADVVAASPFLCVCTYARSHLPFYNDLLCDFWNLHTHFGTNLGRSMRNSCVCFSTCRWGNDLERTSSHVYDSQTQKSHTRRLLSNVWEYMYVCILYIYIKFLLNDPVTDG